MNTVLARPLNTFPSCCVFSLSLSLFQYFLLHLPVTLSLAVSLSVIPVGHLVCFHKTFSVLGLLACWLLKCQMRAKEQWFFFPLTYTVSFTNTQMQASNDTHPHSNINECFLHFSAYRHTVTCMHFVTSSAHIHLMTHTNR